MMKWHARVAFCGASESQQFCFGLRFVSPVLGDEALAADFDATARAGGDEVQDGAGEGRHPGVAACAHFVGLAGRSQGALLGFDRGHHLLGQVRGGAGRRPFFNIKSLECGFRNGWKLCYRISARDRRFFGDKKDATSSAF